MIVFSAFIALTAIPGGIAILLGAEDFPQEWLEGSMFNSYTIPALILTIVVGGSALFAFIALRRRAAYAPICAGAAGAIMMGQIIGELMILEQGSSVPHWIEWVYILLGLILFLFALFQFLAEKQQNAVSISANTH